MDQGSLQVFEHMSGKLDCDETSLTRTRRIEKRTSLSTTPVSLVSSQVTVEEQNERERADNTAIG
jgi:hypothetical protein